MRNKFGTAIGAAVLAATSPGVSAKPASAPELSLAQGRIAGDPEGGVLVFKAIPYAAPPVGPRRWAPPGAPARWKGIRAAKQFGPSCPQTIVPGGFGPWTQEYVPAGAVDEDCLTLNVWKPEDASAGALPVLVWIHGGGFTSGSASVPVYDGAALARQGIVVVSINYRLGLLGFLGSEEFRAAGGGNFGLQDQIAALKWVRENIQAFGGDPARVTIAGQSAGAASVHAMILSPQAKGLFRQAIAQSGIGLGLDPSLGLIGRDAAEAGAASFLEAAGVSSVGAARGLSLTDVNAAYRKLGGRPGEVNGYRPGPYADGAVLPLDPAGAFARGTYNDTPVMIGLTADEGSGLNANYRVADPATYEAIMRTRTAGLADAFLRFYPAASASRSFPAFIRDGGIVSMINWTSLRGTTSRKPLYAYVWTHVEPGPKSAVYGAFHTSEVPYVFGTLDKAGDRRFTAVDRELASTASRYWVNFVKTGDPNGEGVPAWPAYGTGAHLQDIGGASRTYPPLDAELVTIFNRQLAEGRSLLVF